MHKTLGALLIVPLLFCSYDKLTGTSNETETAISGTITYSNGNPVQMADVYLHNWNAIRKNLQPQTIFDDSTGLRSCKTDTFGAFRFDSLDTGRYFIEVREHDTLGVLISAYCNVFDTILADGIVKQWGYIRGKIDTALLKNDTNTFVYIAQIERKHKVDSAGEFIINDLPEFNAGYDIRIIYKDTVVHSILDTQKIPVTAGDTTFISAISLDKGLVAYYPFNSNANDESGNGFNGTIRGNPTYITGVKGTAIRLQGSGYTDSSGDHILLPTPDFSSMKDFSICLWVNETSLTSYDGESYIEFGGYDDTKGKICIFHGGGGTSDTCYLLYSVGIDSTSQISTKIDTTSFSTLYRNRWVFYCMTYNNGLLQAFRDTTIIGTKSQAAVSNYGSNSAIARHWWYNGTTTSTRFTGSIDEVRIYNRALWKAEITALFNAK